MRISNGYASALVELLELGRQGEDQPDIPITQIYFMDENHLNDLCRSGSIAAGKMADYLIPGEVNVIFESKAIEPGDIVSSVFDPELLRDHLKGSFIKGIEQCQESIYRLRQLKDFKNASFFGVVVTHEDFWFASAADIVEYVDPELEARMLKKFGVVPGDQTPVRLCKDSFSRLGQEHGATDHAVCPVESVDGAPAIITCCGRGAPVSPDNQGFALVIQ